MSIGFDGTITEQRKATPIGSIASVPAGTMVTAPSAPVKGASGEHPVVAVDTVHWYRDPMFMSAVGGAFVAVADPIVEYLLMPGPIRWRSFVAAIILAILAWLRKQTNSVVK